LSSDAKISIVTPSYNQGQYIEQCIDSVLSQGYPDLEFIIIDGGSTDNSVEIIKKFSSHLTYWISEPDDGQSHAINKGLGKCTGDVFNWLNSDDYLSPNSLNTIATAFSDPSINVFSGQSNIVQNGEILMQTRGLDVYKDNLSKTIGQARIDQPETYWRKSVLDKVGEVNNHLNFIMDRDWWVKYLLNFGLDGIVQSNDILANFRLHPASKTVDTKDLFGKERNAYFYALSQSCNLNKFNDLFSSLNFEERKNLTANIPMDDQSIIEQSLDYFCCLLAHEYYAASDWKNFQNVMAAINFDNINSVDHCLLLKLNRRTKIIPSRIHRALKR